MKGQITIHQDDEHTAPATLEEAAAIDFQPWSGDGHRLVPSNVEWAALANPHLVMARVAVVMMQRTKSDLIEVASSLEAEGELEALFENIGHTRRLFEAFACLLSGAEARLLS